MARYYQFIWSLESHFGRQK